ncbi:hypothetical protein [Chryseobacterium lathyri]|uniref:Uncharacterized protein n=1 Tax=Chryseobacterium lathyri TaxID=395933 RepID=A0A511YFW5_9FLAO|nr:hypothetical protein [Chryseobacterium lathyri]GEN74100.1 hypothetical protein CLA01_41720 [Chryseobacterium lathyri]
MENLELMPMTDFVLMQSEKMYTKIQDKVGEPKYTVLQFITETPNYAKFLKNENKVWMFVPSDLNGKPLEKPEMRQERDSFGKLDVDFDAEELHQYIKAKDNCFFLVDDYEIADDVVFLNDRQFMISLETGNLLWKTSTYKTIEDIANDPDIKFYLSPRALKKIGI